MKKYFIFAAVTAALAAVSPVCAGASQRDGATIRNSGSTNAPGFTIAVWSDGQTRAISTARSGTLAGQPRSVALAPDVVTRFFRDLRSASREPVTPTTCMKSASFGSTLTVSWHGWISPDLSCPVHGSALLALAEDVTLVQQTAGPNLPHRTIRLPINEPRRVLDSGTPTPLPSPRP